MFLSPAMVTSNLSGPENFCSKVAIGTNVSLAHGSCLVESWVLSRTIPDRSVLVLTDLDGKGVVHVCFVALKQFSMPEQILHHGKLVAPKRLRLLQLTLF